MEEKDADYSKTAITYLLCSWTHFCGVPFAWQGMTAEGHVIVGDG